MTKEGLLENRIENQLKEWQSNSVGRELACARGNIWRVISVNELIIGQPEIQTQGNVVSYQSDTARERGGLAEQASNYTCKNVQQDIL